MRKLVIVGCAFAVVNVVALRAQGAGICSGESAAVRIEMPMPTAVTNELTICVLPWIGVGESVAVYADGTCLFSTTNQRTTAWCWHPLTLGDHTLTCMLGTNVLTKTLNVAAIDSLAMSNDPNDPNPPMAKDNRVGIRESERSFGAGFDGGAINTTGSGSWTAAVSDSWITLVATNGNAGVPVYYTVSANTNVEHRTGYVYVSGWVYTVRQEGVAATIAPENASFEHLGGTGTISVAVVENVAWGARSNVGWINLVSPKIGCGAGSVAYCVAPYDELATREGTLTIAENTFTVIQHGRRMKLASYNAILDYETQFVKIRVNAFDSTQWSVTPKASWISVVDAGDGHGSDLVTIRIEKNLSYEARIGTVNIGTETFTVTQYGVPTERLTLDVFPARSTASVDGTNGIITVTATLDLPWSATSSADWLAIHTDTVNGTGNGNIRYSVEPNLTLVERTGRVTVTPEDESGVAAKTHTVIQSAAQSSLSAIGYEFEAEGGRCGVDVGVDDTVQWNISESLDWLTVDGSASRTGPGTVMLRVQTNDTVYSRSGIVMIAGKQFRVSQKAWGVELGDDTKLFGTDGGMDTVSIHPENNASWTASTSHDWIRIIKGDSGTGDGEIEYIVAPFADEGVRMGWISVGDRKLYIAQRTCDVSIEPNGTIVKGGADIGDIKVSMPIGNWAVGVTESWISWVYCWYDEHDGCGVVSFYYMPNDTGKTRVGKIVVAGEVYTLTQLSRHLVEISAAAEHGGQVLGGGFYDIGTQVTLTAVPDSGYVFSRWVGMEESPTQNPFTFTVDAAKSYTAVFTPMPIAFTNLFAGTDGVAIAWNNLAWASTYRIYRGTTSALSSATVLVELPNDGTCTYLDASGNADHYYWIEAEGPLDKVISDSMKPYSPITYKNLRGATNPNPAMYQKGTIVSFVAPGAVTGYTFAGWTPSQITADMSGAQTVWAEWTANRYSIIYNPNGGSGAMEATEATYDIETTIASNGFTWASHGFIGWATNETGSVVYAAGQMVSNLTVQANGVVTLYAVWSNFHIDENGVLTGVDLNGATEIAIPDGVTSIAENAFSGCSGLMRVTIPDSVTRIGANAFSGCNDSLFDMETIPGVKLIDGWVIGNTGSLSGHLDLTGVRGLADGNIFNGVFGNCRGLTSVAIPDSVIHIGVCAFYNCSGLTSVTIGNGVTSIGSSAFFGCSGLRDVTVPQCVLDRQIRDVFSAAYSSLTNVSYSSVITNIGSSAFYGCRVLTSVTIPDSVTSIGNAAFYGCSSLARVTVGNSVASIGAESFYGCNRLTSMSMPPCVTNIGEAAFSNCSGLTSVTIPDSVTSIGSHAFYGCSRLESVHVTDIARWCEISFGDGSANPLYHAHNLYLDGSLIEDLTIPDSVTIIGEYAFYCCSGLKRVTIPDSVTSIGFSAFSGCSGLTSVAIPNSVTSFGEWAFSGCNSVRDVTVPGHGCGIPFENVTNLVISEGTTSIGDYAFSGCSGLTSVTIPDSVMSIGTMAFWGCSDLTSVTICNGVTSIGASAFACCDGLASVTIPDSVVSIGNGAFHDCIGLKNVTIGSGVTSIVDGAFLGCSGLTSVTIPASVTSIGAYAFFDCRGLTSVNITDLARWCGISFSNADANPLYEAHNLYLNGEKVTDLTIPDGVTSIGAYAFYNCSGLTSVTIPDSVTSIGEEAFFGCSGLEGVHITDLARWCGIFFGDASANPLSYVHNLYLGGSLITDLTIPDSVTDIGDYAFSGCSGLESVTIGNGVTNIGVGAFSNCGSLGSFNVADSNKSFSSANRLLLSKDGETLVLGVKGNVTIPDSVTSIGAYAFYNCSGLTSVTIPNSVTSIGTYAFYGCSGLTSVHVADIAKWCEISFEDMFANPFFRANNLYLGGSLIQDLAIPDGVTSIGDWAFSHWLGLTNVTIPEGVTDIGRGAFDCCSGMTSVTIPSSVTSIGDGAFYGCSGLTSVRVSLGDAERVKGLMGSSGFNVSGVRFIEIVWISFDANGGSVGELMRSAEEGGGIGTLPVPTRTGYTFSGWWTSASGGSQIYASTQATGNTTYYARWTPRRYTVTFDANGGTGGWSKSMDYGVAITVPTVSRTGYTFMGWTPAVAATVPIGGATYTAKWTVNQYTVTFDANGGKGGKTVTQDYGTTLSAPSVTRIGYTFTGWSPSVPSTVPAGNVTYKAQWRINRYAVMFDANGGVGGMTNEQDYGAAIIVPSVTREGHTFAGWDPAPPATVPASNVTCTAQWAVNQYTVTFDANGGTGGKTVTQDYGTALSAPTVMREGYTFTGWSPAAPATVPAANATYVAQWTKNQYTVTFDANDGTGGWSRSMDYGAAITAPTVTRTGYTFTGWTPAVAATVPAGNLSYTAQWKVNQYTVTFNANGGTGGKTVTQDYGTALAAPTVSRTGYTFSGWSPSVPATVPAGNATYTAQWKVNQYTVTFDANGGKGGASVTQDYGTALAAPVVTRTGYTFTGWSPSVPSTVPAGNATYTAQWTANRYTVTFDANGGTGTMVDLPMVYDIATTLLSNVFARTDAWFMGWSAAPGGELVYMDGESVINLTSLADDVVTLYAVWQEKPASVLACEEAFGGAGIVTLDESDNVVVTLTNDVSGTVEIPDNVGTVIIDLNGHDIVGDGGLGETALPDGPAIRIVKGDSECVDVTQLAIVDTSYGEKGQVAGGGEKAGIEIADGVAYNISVEVGDAVSVLNGDGTEQDCSSLGRGSLPWPDDGAYNPLVANVYDGYVLDGDGALAGVVQIKAAKQAVKSVTDKMTKVKTATTNITVTATVTDAAGKKWSYSKGVGAVDGVVTGLVCTTKGVLVPSFGVTLGANGLEGELGGFLVAGARNGMGTKGDAMVSALDANYKKSWTVALTNEMGATHLQLVVGANGSVKISGVTPDGFKISATVNGVMGDDAFFVPYLATLKSGKLTRPANLLLTLGEDGTVYVRTSDFGSLKAGGPTTDAIAVQPYAESATSKGGEPYAGAVVLNDLAYPAKFAAKGLPAGLKIDAASGAITGTPTKPGHYTATITVTSGINSKKKVETKVEFVIGNYTDTAIGVEDSYSGYCVGVMASESIAAALGCSVSGLPAGLKFAAKETKDKTFGTVPAGTVYGIPTKAGECTVYFKKSEKVNGKSVNHQASATFKVEALPDWAQGTFSGGLIEAALSGGGHAGSVTLPAGLMSLTVDSKGKISGKLIDSAGTWTLSAASYSNVERPSSDVDDSVFHVTVIGKNGKLMATNEVAVALDDASRSASAPYRRGVASCGEWTAWQNLWKTDPWKNDAKAYAKAPKLMVGEIELKFGASGAVTAKYGKYSCSTTLIPVEDGTFYVLCYFVPKGEAAYGAEIFLKWDAAEKKFSAVDQ